MPSTASRIRWKRVAWMAAFLALVVAGAMAGWIWLAARDAPRMPSGLGMEQSWNELNLNIALLNEYGVPTSSLVSRCDAGSPDAIHAFQRPGGMLMSEDSPAAVFLQGDRVIEVRLHRQPPHSFKAIAKSSTANAQRLRSIWTEADRMMKTTMPASSFGPETWSTDSGEIAIEMCRNGRYAFVERYLGTPDPDNQVLDRFNDLLWQVSREAAHP